MSDRHRWYHCDEHNVDYPSGSVCPLCEIEQHIEDLEGETAITDTHKSVHPNAESKWCLVCMAIRLKRKLRNLWFDLRIKYWQLRVAIDEYRDKMPEYTQVIKAKRPEGPEPPTPEPQSFEVKLHKLVEEELERKD